MNSDSEDKSKIDSRRKKNENANRNKGLHETWDDYNRCATREANEGLYLGKRPIQGLKKVGTTGLVDRVRDEMERFRS